MTTLRISIPLYMGEVMDLVCYLLLFCQFITDSWDRLIFIE